MSEIAQLIAIPIIAALTGYATNALAVRMLFRPRRERRFLGLRIQGLIPKRRDALADKLGEAVEAHLISHDDLRAALADPSLAQGVHDVFDERVETLLRERLAGIHPMVNMLLNDQLLSKLKALVMGEIMGAMPQLADRLAASLEERIDFKELVSEKIRAFDMERFEGIVLEISRRELRAIELWGAALGFLVGLLTDAMLMFF